MTPAQRVGIYGGAFDPPHLAHKALAQAAIEQLQLDVLHIVPTGHAWHKTSTLSAPAHRLAMARLAFGSLPRVVVDAQEIEREGASYTIDTLEQLQNHHPSALFYLLIGHDQARALHTWKRWQQLQQNAIICIADRATTTPASGIIEPEHAWIARAPRLQMPVMAHSSTDIRQRAAHGLAIDHLVEGGIARYIAKHQLYTNPSA
jgi:nicotinate-nucleotide adenylyltransferase